MCAALVAEECVRQLQRKVHSNRGPAVSASSQQDLDRSLKNKQEVSRNSLIPTPHLMRAYSGCCVNVMCVSCSSTKTRGGAVRMFPINPQTVMSAMCQPSLEPAVPLASVAPATCPFNRRDPEDASGSACTHAIHEVVKIIQCKLMGGGRV